MKLANCLLALAVSGCATTFEDRWEPVKPLLEWQDHKGDRKQPVRSTAIRTAQKERP
jgi:hypothetical protein